MKTSFDDMYNRRRASFQTSVVVRNIVFEQECVADILRDFVT